MKIKRLFVFIIALSLMMTAMPTISSALEPSDFVVVSGVLTTYRGTDPVITIPDGVIFIDDYVFNGHSELMSVTIPSSVTSIGIFAFAGCSGLTSITIPSSVGLIGTCAFINCTSLTQFIVADANLIYASQDGLLFNKPITTLICCPAGKTGSYVIPGTVNSVYDYSFYGCVGITGVVMPNSVANIGGNAFYGCTGLTNINISNNVTDIVAYTFFGCSGLTKLSIPIGVRTIGNSAFTACTGLTSVSLPYTLLNIGGYAFYNCTGLTGVTIPNRVLSISSQAFEGCIGLTEAFFLGTAPSIGDNVFNLCAPTFKIFHINNNISYTNPWYGYTTTDMFSDIGLHWSMVYINSLAAIGVISGYKVSPGEYVFRPANPMQRQEFAKIITVAYDVYQPTATSSFSDCPTGSWFTPYVGSLENEGLTSGLGDGSYGVGINMSRQDTCTLLSRAMIRYQGIVLPGTVAAATVVSSFSDAADIANYARPPIAFFVNAGIIRGYESSPGSGIFEYRPRANITRAEISKIMVMSLEYVPPTPAL